ncbi:MAG: signal peptidase I [Anaerovoracaceae bacterium]
MKETVKEIGIMAAVLIIGLQFYKPTRVFGRSMLPNFKENDYLIISTEAYRRSGPKRGDVIVFESKNKDSKGRAQRWIKRVIGLPGEKVEIRDGKCYVDGKLQDSSYTKDGTTSGDVSVTVGEDEYFCMGDNRAESVDSRSSDVGCISRDKIIGKVIFRLYPVGKAGRIR